MPLLLLLAVIGDAMSDDIAGGSQDTKREMEDDARNPTKNPMPK
jgi:hypothetical protein